MTTSRSEGANALEDNVALYKTVNGNRTALDIVGRKGGYGVNAESEPFRTPIPIHRGQLMMSG